MEIWQRLPKEPERAYAAFKVYCELGSDRTLKEVSRQTQLAISTIKEYSSHYKWPDRARAFSIHHDKSLESAIQSRVSVEAEKWAKRRQEFRESCFEYGEKLMDRAKEMLRFPLQKVERKNDETGETVIIKPARWNSNTIVHTLRLGIELGMLSTGLAPGTHPLDEVDWDNISSEDLDKILKDANITLGKERD